MAQLQVPEKYMVELKELALRDARPVQEVVSEAMDAYLSFRFTEAHLSSAQMERMKQSLAQAERGELISEQQVEAFFDDWEKEAANR
jgi:predicted transcriptional regulator